MLLPLKQLTPKQREPAAAAAAAGGGGSDDDGGDALCVDTSESETEESDGSDGANDDMCSTSVAAEIAASAPEGGVTLAERIKQLSPFGTGKMWTADMKRHIILAAYHRMHGRYEVAKRTGRALKPAAGTATAVATYFGANRSRVSEVLHEFAPDGLEFDTPHMDFAESDLNDRKARTDVTDLTDSQVSDARKFMRTRADVGSTTTWPQLHRHLTADSGLVTSLRVMRERLVERGFGVVPVRSAPVVDLRSDYWQRQRERFVVQYAAAREEELQGKAVIVFCDESFVNLRHRRHNTVADLDGDNIVTPHRSGKKALLRTGIGRGKLIIICHAITRDGLLARLGPDGDIDRPNQRLTELQSALNWCTKVVKAVTIIMCTLTTLQCYAGQSGSCYRRLWRNTLERPCGSFWTTAETTAPCAPIT